MKSDHQLKQDVIAELQWEPAVDENEIGVAVKDGIVTLTGHLKSYAEKHAAEEAAQRVSGIKGLAEEIEVRLPGLSKRSDADIALHAQRGLEWNALVPRDKIQIKVENSWITLSGEVDWNYQRLAAKNALRNLMGVVGISNQIVVKPKVLPKNIKASIEAALQRRAHEETESLSILVSGNEVTLAGSVPSYSERRAAYLAAASAPGVAHVIDKMVVI